MKILVIGGTAFLGRHIVREMLSRGHTVTLFNRGVENPELFPEAERITGDRRSDLAKLRGRRFDVVVDTCGYLPEDVAASSAALAASQCYVFISSVAVYRDLFDGTSEDAPLHPTVGSLTLSPTTLGPLKAACEHALIKYFPGRALIVRPGLIVGPDDIASRARVDAKRRNVGPLDYDSFSPRFPYWVQRFEAGGCVLLPGRPAAPVQVIDVRDVAEWIVTMIEQRRWGTFNATGPITTMSALMKTCQNREAECEWVDDSFLLRHGVYPFVELPLWTLPGALNEALLRVPATPATESGLRYRSLGETVEAVRVWAREHPHLAIAPRTPVLSRERERDLLIAWHHASSSGSADKTAPSATDTS
ncbi:MAG TPA: NAD-dependent epimerase/dehydratase family protein [Thermoanaerobaculia bacterium]|nr:NAD-dependent epimerase/dehydratase family protein [Thermoanaerobaculia bacterium]